MLKDILPIDPELVTFKNIDEAIVKIKYYLNNPTKRYEISRTIYDWFKSRYSYDNLVDIILNKI
ncbi:glycosyltransferase family protein [Parabacteroides goldsteinii]|uniref:glycosyltransferase family protein n=1 Tax=Parabacteroides goldsteinii TaxID=328812 RepID=UPI003D70800C